MSLLKIFLKKNESRFSRNLIILFFLSFFLVGLVIFKNFGLSIDEPFHRTTGYYWLYILSKDIIPSSNYHIYLKNLLDEMEWSQDFLAGYYQAYGPFFDLLTAIIEQVIGIETSKEAFQLKHLLTFLTFFISGIYFFKLVNERFNNNFFSLFLVFLYFTSPRIFAESFYNCKDIIFMSFCIFSISHFFSSFKNFSLNHLLFFSLFAAIATQIRVMGILLILVYIIFVFWEVIENRKEIKKNYSKILICIISYFVFLYALWPFLWADPVGNFIEAFLTFSNYDWNLKVFYLGEYINANNLPWHYSIVWIFVTSPTFYIISFLMGLTYIFKIFFKNLTSLDQNQNNKLWKNDNQKKDFFMMFFLISPVVSIIFLNSTLYGGWRHLYFIYPSIIYIMALGLEYFYFKIKKFINFKIILVCILLLIILNLHNLIRFHPYQHIYFNPFIKKIANKNFEIDYWGLANHEAIEFIVEDSKKNNFKTVSIRTASFTPLSYSRKILDFNENQFLFQGTTHSDQQYIFTNFHYEKNPKYQKKYFIPKNYYEVFSVKRAGILINKVYKKKD